MWYEEHTPAFEGRTCMLNISLVLTHYLEVTRTLGKICLGGMFSGLQEAEIKYWDQPMAPAIFQAQ